jgi:tetratricopeptide (TPR) repeat protein
MGLWDVYHGRQTWDDYLRSRLHGGELEQLFQRKERTAEASLVKRRPGSITLNLSAGERHTALESGLGALDVRLGRSEGESDYGVEFEVEKLAGGLDRLNADFHLLLGDLIWKLEIHQETLNDLLQEIRLAEFEREARAYRTRAERAYLNGWYEEALGDFFEAEKRNYPDFAVHRSIGTICLYHVINLPQALESFRKAAKYARPSDPRQSAEAHYFAGVVCILERRLADGLAEMHAAVELNPEFYEAHYQAACIAAVLGDPATAIAGLKSAIEGDPRYFERVKNDPVFDQLRPQVQTLLDELMKPVFEKVAEVEHEIVLPKGYVIVQPEEERILGLFQKIKQQVAAAKNYPDGVRFLQALSQIQQELDGIYDRFYKHYEIDPQDYIRSVAFSPDGRWLTAGFLNGAIRIWEVETGLEVLSLTEHLASVNSVAYSLDGLWLASGSRDKTIKLWDAATGGLIHTLQGHSGEVRAVAFSPDGQWLVSGSHDYTVRLWRVVTGREVQTWTGHRHQVTSAVFSPDGRVVASASMDKTIKLWDVTTGQPARTLTGHERGVASLAFSPDGRWLASGGDDRRIKIWEAATGREIQTLSGLWNSITSVAFSPDGNLLAAGNLGHTIMVWKLSTGQVVKTLRFSQISYNSVAFSPRGQWLALGSRDLQLWLKVILTEAEYAAVKAAEARASQASMECGGLTPLW